MKLNRTETEVRLLTYLLRLTIFVIVGIRTDEHSLRSHVGIVVGLLVETVRQYDVRFFHPSSGCSSVCLSR